MTDLEGEVEEDVVLAVLFLVLEEVLMEGAVRVHPVITHIVLILGSREGTYIICSKGHSFVMAKTLQGNFIVFLFYILEI